MVTNTHEYRNRDKQLLGYTIRMEDRDGRKQVLPVAYCHNEIKGKSRWQLKGFSDNGTKPIYGLEKLSQCPNKLILIVEGEKTADAASILLPDYNVISWMGGAQAVDKVDWSKLAGRVVSIWPDNDKPRMMAAKSIANHIDCSNGFSGLVSIVDTENLGLPKKWDLADELPNSMKHTNLNEIIDNSREDSATIGDRLEMSRDYENQKSTTKKIPDSIDILVAQGRIDKDEYSSRLIYNDTIVAIAKSKDINLGKIKDHREFIDAITNLQQEYQDLHREYNERVREAGNMCAEHGLEVEG